MSFLAAVGVGGLLERDAELAVVDRALERVRAGVGAVLVVGGPAGIGKSELLAAMGRAAQACDFGLLRARGSEFEAGMAFGVARQLFEPMLRTASLEERRWLLDGVARVGAWAVGVEEGEPPADRFAAIHGLYWLCANRAERSPLAVAVDDVQWADDPSLAWLGYVARRVSDLPLLLVLGLRSGEPGGERAELAQLTARGARRMVLGPLSAAAVGEIVRSELNDGAEESFCEAVSELSGGNPLFVRELLAAAREERLPARSSSSPVLQRIAPRAVGSSVLARLGRLDARSAALAYAVAVLGAGAEVVVAARLADMDPDVAELAADRLAAAQILASVRPLEFFHPLIGAAVLESIAPGARRVAHRRAAELVDDEVEGSLPRVAAHLLACGAAADRWVAQRLADAAREALERGAPEVAASYARRALAEPPEAAERAAVLLSLGTAEWRAGQPDAIAHLEQALAGAGNDHRTLVSACDLLGFAYYVTDQAERAVEVRGRALAAIGDADARLVVRLEASAALAGMTNERTAPAAIRRAEGLRRRLRTLTQPPVDLLMTLAYDAARANRADEAQELAERLLAREPYPPPLRTINALMNTLMIVECYDALQKLGEEVLKSARQRGAMQELAGISVWRAAASYDCGALADAEADARWALEHGTGLHRMRAVADLIRVLIDRDELQKAEDVLNQFGDPRGSHSIDVPRFLFARGQLRRAQGLQQEALDDFLESGRRYDRVGQVRRSSVQWSEVALAHAALGSAEEARRLAGEQLALARAAPRPRMLGISLRVSGLVEGGDTGLELLAEAVKTLERSQSPLELSRALTDYGAALRRGGRRAQARAELERALDLAHRCGARRIAARGRAELIAAGAKPRRDAITGRDALTAGELRVARLAADGLTNREIAQALFITTRTAKGHLSRVYHKLGITRRGQLAAALTGPLQGTREASGAPAPIC